MAGLPELDGAFLAQEAIDAGCSARRLAGLVRRGELLRLSRGLYVPAASWAQMSPQQRHLTLIRAALRAVPRAVASHRSAALVHGLPTPYGALGAIRMTVAADDRTSRPRSWVQLHRGTTALEHVALVGGLPVTTVARTVIDCFREDGLGEGLAVGDAALRAGLVTVGDLGLVRRQQRRWPGVSRAGQGMPLLDGRRESWLESFSAGTLSGLGIPPGVPQVVVLDERGRFVARVDVGWPEIGLVGEADGRGKYLGDVADGLGRGEDAAAMRVMAAARRESRLRELGLGVIRWDTPEIVRRPRLVADRWLGLARAADPDRCRAQLRCSCHRLSLTDCSASTGSGRQSRLTG